MSFNLNNKLYFHSFFYPYVNQSIIFKFKSLEQLVSMLNKNKIIKEFTKSHFTIEKLQQFHSNHFTIVSNRLLLGSSRTDLWEQINDLFGDRQDDDYEEQEEQEELEIIGGGKGYEFDENTHTFIVPSEWLN